MIVLGVVESKVSVSDSIRTVIDMFATNPVTIGFINTQHCEQNKQDKTYKCRHARRNNMGSMWVYATPAQLRVRHQPWDHHQKRDHHQA